MRNGFLFPLVIATVFLSSLANSGLEDGLACEAFDLAMTDSELKTQTIYRKNSWGVCVETDGTAENNYEYHFFRDAQCNSEIDFHRRPDIANICIDLYNQTTADPDPITFGNADSWTPDVLSEDPLNGQFDSKKWTVARGTRYSATIFNNDDQKIPFMKKIAYREVGECKLEMRIYKEDMDAVDLKPILFLHGGSYESHLGLLPMEAEVNHFTDAGYLVFVPFYRLAHKLDAVKFGANVECREASINDMTSDVQAAMEFAIQNGPALGSNGNKIDVFGQSAGGTLATWLALSSTNSYNGLPLKEWVNRLVLIYPALDIIQSLKLALIKDNEGKNKNPRGIEIMSSVFDLEVKVGDEILSTQDKQALAAFAMNDLVEGETSPLPPIFIMHGVEDSLVPIDTSEDFCNAYSKNQNNKDSTCNTDLSNTIDNLLINGTNENNITGSITECNCGPSISRNGTNQTSILHKIEFSGHGYDACLGTSNTFCFNLEITNEEATNTETNDEFYARTLAAKKSWDAMLSWLAQED